MTAIDIDKLQQWVGRTQTRDDVISAAPVAALSATLKVSDSLQLSASLNLPFPRARVGDALPACWHWLYFQEFVPTANLASDGHPPRGDFLPPVPLPRRMWAGSQLRFTTSRLLVGDEARRVSTIQSVRHKQGRSGDLVFVTVRHQVFRGATLAELALEEEQELVYREPAISATQSAVQPRSAPAVAQWSREIHPDPVLLFRYSALTFNSHRIHYDRDYAMREEGYDGLVVQGPLTATLLLDLLQRELPCVRLATFEFRAIRPLLENAMLRLQGRRDGQVVSLWALDVGGELAMEARAGVLAE